VIATALGWSDLGQLALAAGLAYVFGFALTAVPLVRAGLTASVVISTALAADTISITIMEVIDNLTVAVGFVSAYPFAFLANRYMIARGKGQALVHEHHGH
jgi:Domain of unknown function (DUF4396)